MKSLSLDRPYLLITVGIPGSGKSQFAEKFAATFGAPYVKYDTILHISANNGRASDGFAGYFLHELFKTNHTVIFDGPTATRAERAALRDLAASAGYTSLFIWVQTDLATAKDRFAKTARKQGHRVSGAHYDALVKEFVAPSEKEHPFVVISGKHTYATQVKAVLKNLTLAKQTARTVSGHSHTTLSNGKRSITVK